MGKITVIHFLNKNLKPKIINNEKHYPVYLQITRNRKNHQFKSTSEQLLTEKEFKNYINGVNYSGKYFTVGDKYSKEYFEREPIRIQRACEFYDNHVWLVKKYDKKMIEILWSIIKNELLKNTKERLIYDTWQYLTVANEAKNTIYKPFNKKNNFIDTLKELKNIYEIEIIDKVPAEDLELWENITLLLSNITEDSLYIDFICDFENVVNNTEKIKNKATFIKTIDDIIKQYYLI